MRTGIPDLLDPRSGIRDTESLRPKIRDWKIRIRDPGKHLGSATLVTSEETICNEKMVNQPIISYSTWGKTSLKAIAVTSDHKGNELMVNQPIIRYLGEDKLDGRLEGLGDSDRGPYITNRW